MDIVHLQNIRNVRFQEMKGEKKGLAKTQACDIIQRKA
jgi:hypothetical protein